MKMTMVSLCEESETVRVCNFGKIFHNFYSTIMGGVKSYPFHSGQADRAGSHGVPTPEDFLG